MYSADVGETNKMSSSKFTSVERLRYRSACYAELVDWVTSINTSTKREVYCRPASGDVLIEVVPESADTILGEVGLGIYISMTPEEALKFSENEAKFFAEMADKLEQEAAQEVATELAVEKARQHGSSRTGSKS